VREGSGLFILRIAFGGGDDGLSVEIFGEDLESRPPARRTGPGGARPCPASPTCGSSRDPGRPERVIEVDREKIARLGLTMNQVAEVIETNLAGTRATVLRQRRPGVRHLGAPRRAATATSWPTSSRSPWSPPRAVRAARSVVDDLLRRGPVIIDRKDQERVIYVSGNVTGRDLGSVAEDARQALRRSTCRTASRSSWAASTRSSRRPTQLLDRHAAGDPPGLHGDGGPVREPARPVRRHVLDPHGASSACSSRCS
jgi:hydrophobic/amphiphilic exporter-1 (mainly G- bacteria), HAE1 family